jgi:putative heme utilization carrier protein HutX
MSIAAQKTDDRQARAAAALAEKPDGIVEAIAAKAEVTSAEVLAILPQGAAVSADSDQFDAIWNELRGWGEVLMIVQTGDIVLEVPGHLPEGTESHGWFNIHGDSPIGGHIKKDNCAGITFVDRGFHGRRSCSVWFMNAAGGAMFKIFVRRDENKELRGDQLAKFEALRNGFRG